VPRLYEFYPGICLTSEEKARKNLSQGKHYMGNTQTNKKKPQKDVSLLGYKFFQSHICFTEILMLESSARG
jgi:hypothetical protein